MTVIVNIHEAKTHLSRLLLRVQAGEDVIIAHAGKPVARLVSVEHSGRRRKPGSLVGQFAVPSDFNEPLSEDILRDFGV
jgi:prevent-host-death family protein